MPRGKCGGLVIWLIGYLIVGCRMSDDLVFWLFGDVVSGKRRFDTYRHASEHSTT